MMVQFFPIKCLDFFYFLACSLYYDNWFSPRGRQSIGCFHVPLSATGTHDMGHMKMQDANQLFGKLGIKQKVQENCHTHVVFQHLHKTK